MNKDEMKKDDAVNDETIRQSEDDVTNQIFKLQKQREELQKQTQKLMLTKANSFYVGKWVMSGERDCIEYYHIKSVDRLNTSYAFCDSRPSFSCTCDRSIGFTYFKCLRVYQEDKSDTLNLDEKTKVLTSDEIKAVIKKFRTEMTNALDDLENNFC